MDVMTYFQVIYACIQKICFVCQWPETFQYLKRLIIYRKIRSEQVDKKNTLISNKWLSFFVRGNYELNRFCIIIFWNFQFFSSHLETCKCHSLPNEPKFGKVPWWPLRFLWILHHLILSLKYQKPENFSFLAPTVCKIWVLKVLGNFTSWPILKKIVFLRPYQWELICF